MYGACSKTYRFIQLQIYFIKDIDKNDLNLKHSHHNDH